MAKTIVVALFIMAVFWHAPDLSAESAYYVQCAKAKVLSGATFKSAILGEVERGHRFISSGTEGDWIKVKYKDGEGYVPSIVLSTHPPIGYASLIEGNEQELRQGFRRRASEARRVLDRDYREQGGHGDHADYESLEKIELFTISSWEVKRFMEGEQ